jgi:hypothetical protein
MSAVKYSPVALALPSRVSIENHGSVILVRPLDSAAHEWLTEMCVDAQWFGNAMACEPRYLDQLLDGMLSFGIEVE